MKYPRFCLLLCVFLTGCSTITIQPYTRIKRLDTPNWQATTPYYWFGMVGEHRINISEICDDRTMAQIQVHRTPNDQLYAIFTWGIYTPHTIKVWCEKK